MKTIFILINSRLTEISDNVCGVSFFLFKLCERRSIS